MGGKTMVLFWLLNISDVDTATSGEKPTEYLMFDLSSGKIKKKKCFFSVESLHFAQEE
jgi:hypothetical protein